MGKTALSRFLERFDRIHFILADNDDIHKSLNEFEIRLDPTMDYGVGCPCASRLIMKKMTSSHFLRFFIWSFSYLQAMKTCIIAWMSSKFGKIRPLVSMATDSVIIWKKVLPLFLGCS